MKCFVISNEIGQLKRRFSILKRIGDQPKKNETFRLKRNEEVDDKMTMKLETKPAKSVDNRVSHSPMFILFPR